MGNAQYICHACGSDDVRFEAQGKWDAENQKTKLEERWYGHSCDSCGNEYPDMAIVQVNYESWKRTCQLFLQTTDSIYIDPKDKEQDAMNRYVLEAYKMGGLDG